MDYESQMRSWLVDPAKSDDEDEHEDEEEENGARVGGA